MAWVAPERIRFVLPKIGSKLELYLMWPLRANYVKICQSPKSIKDAEVYGWGRQISKIAQLQRTCQLRVCLRKLMHRNALSLFTKAFYTCLHKNLALSCGFKLVSADIFGSSDPKKNFDQKKKKNSLSSDPCPCQLEYWYTRGLHEHCVRLMYCVSGPSDYIQICLGRDISS